MVNIRRQSTEAHKSRAEARGAPEALELSAELHALLRVLWSGKWKSAAPHAFVQAVWTHGGLFAARRQQDASEFLGFLLDRRPPTSAQPSSVQPSSIPSFIIHHIPSTIHHSDTSLTASGSPPALVASP